jgi:tetratricopeptide (TPR) repeat protein
MTARLSARLACALLLVSSVAAADNAAKADALFNKGKKLQNEKRFSDACPTFEEVDKLDPGIGAKLNVAKCYEEWGRLATAYSWYEQALAMAVSTKDDRLPKIKQLADTLDVDVPRLKVNVPEGANPDRRDDHARRQAARGGQAQQRSARRSGPAPRRVRDRGPDQVEDGAARARR